MKLAAPVFADKLRKKTQIRFGGYDALGTEGAVCSMENMTSDYYPELASRDSRYIIRTWTDTYGMMGGEVLAIAAGTGVALYGREGYMTTVAGILDGSDAERQIAQLGSYIVVWPDKKYIRLGQNGSVVSGSVEADLTVPTVYFESRTAPSGISYQYNCLYISDAATASAVNDAVKAGDALALNCAGILNTTAVLREKQYNPEGLRLYFDDNLFDTDLRRRCTLTAYYAAEQEFVIKDESPWRCFVTPVALGAGDVLYLSEAEDVVEFPDGTTAEVYAYTPSSAGAAEISFTEASGTGVTIKRSAPELDFLFEHANRLWGCRGKTIYASALGDPFNWNVFDGVSTDSWATDTGSGGDFTGAISYGGYPRFFKQERIYTLYGEIPEEFQLLENTCYGVQAGSGRSLAAVNGSLYYLSPVGPCVYQGGMPTRIARDFGPHHYENGVGGVSGRKYYLSMQDENGDWHLFVYDTERSLWMREDALHLKCAANYAQSLFGIADRDLMWALGSKENLPGWAHMALETQIPWSAEFGDIAEQNPHRKRITKIMLRLELETGCSATVYIKYDSADEWKHVSTVTAARKKSVLLPLIPRRWDHIRLKIEGTGQVRISSLALETATGSDRG